MSEEERKEKPQKTKITIPSLLVALSCLFFVLALFPYWNPIPHTPDYRTMCIINLHELGKAMLIYANDYNDMLPTPSKWCDLLIEHIAVNKERFRCLNEPRGPSNYAMNKNVELLGSQAPTDMVLLFETGPGWNQSGGSEILTTANHLWEGCNILFFDFNVRFVRAENIPKLKWKPDEVQEE